MDSEQSTLFNKIDNYLEEEEDKKDTDFDEWFKSYVNESHNNQKTDEPKPLDDELKQSKFSEDNMHRDESENKVEGELQNEHQNDSEYKSQDNSKLHSEDNNETSHEAQNEDKSEDEHQDKSEEFSESDHQDKSEDEQQNNSQDKHENESQDKNESEDEVESEIKSQDKNEPEDEVESEIKSQDKHQYISEDKSQELLKHVHQDEPEDKSEDKCEVINEHVEQDKNNDENAMQKEIFNAKVQNETISNPQNENDRNENEHSGQNTQNETQHRPGRRKIRVKKEKVGQVKNFPNGSIEIGDSSKSKQPTDKEIIENIEKSKNKLINDINEQVKEMELNGNCKHIDPNTYNTNAKLFNVFYQYIIGKLFVPRNCVLTLDINEYINNTTVFKYNAFDAPNTSMQHPIPEKIIFLTKLNNIFNFQFVNSASGDFHFNDLDKQVTTFLYKYKDYGTTRLEYGIIKSLMGKLIIALNTSCELALRDNTKPRLSTEFKQAIIRDIECMKYIQSPDGKLYTSWKTFLNSLLSIGSDNLIYVHDNYPSLNTKLKTAYENDFLTENLLANMLKCYLPSVAINYFYVIKSIYIVSRLLSIYIQEKLYITTSKKKSFEEIVNDIYAIATVGAIMYENKSYIFKQMTRTLPKYDKEITENTKMYILNHLLTGGQYYILKMFEESLPVVASLLV